MKKYLNCSGRLLDLSTPIIMGILNLSPDSFFDGGKYPEEKNYIDAVRLMLDQGAGIIDIGAQSTRPGASLLASDEEWSRLHTPLKNLQREFPDAIFSIDTFYSSVAKKSVELGVSMVNDVSAGSIDPKMFSTVAALKVPYVLMHMQGVPATMQANPKYDNVSIELIDFFSEKTEQLLESGVTDIIIDPGFGFGKSMEHNFLLLKKLAVLKIHDMPILAGLSRKSMVSKVLGIKSNEALNGTTVLNTIALMKGADILRVHDVKEAVECVKLVTQLKKV
ncbi:MAG: dihydropteroate synthase [Bacteroidetes bacterium]|nr:MAG: dihydropteroate synthase [Bacteroidota bacterium]